MVRIPPQMTILRRALCPLQQGSRGLSQHKEEPCSQATNGETVANIVQAENTRVRCLNMFKPALRPTLHHPEW